MKLIKFENEGCSACQMVENLLLSEGIEVEHINVFDNPEKAVSFDIGSIPVTILLDSEGKEVQRSIGFKPPELMQMIELFTKFKGGVV